MPAAKMFAKPATYKIPVKQNSPSLTSSALASKSSAQNHGNHEHTATGTVIKHVNEVQVVGTGEVFLPPDRCRLCVSVSSEKTDVDEVKSSVTRRLDYIMQAMHNHGVKVCCKWCVSGIHDTGGIACIPI